MAYDDVREFPAGPQKRVLDFIAAEVSVAIEQELIRRWTGSPGAAWADGLG